MAIVINGTEYQSQRAYIDAVKGTDQQISASTLADRVKSNNPKWSEWFTLGSGKDSAATRTLHLKMEATKANLFELALDVCDLDRSSWIESAARGLILNTIHILRDYETDRPDIDVDQLEKAFLDAWKVRPGSVLRKHLDEVA